MVKDESWTEDRGPKQAVVEKPQRTIWKYEVTSGLVNLPKKHKFIRYEVEGDKTWLWIEVSPSDEVTRFSLERINIPVLEEFELELNKGSTIIEFKNIDGFLTCLVLNPVNGKRELKKIRAFKTGAEMPKTGLIYLGCAAIFIQQELMLYYFQDILDRKQCEETPSKKVDEFDQCSECFNWGQPTGCRTCGMHSMGG